MVSLAYNCACGHIRARDRDAIHGSWYDTNPPPTDHNSLLPSNQWLRQIVSSGEKTYTNFSSDKASIRIA